jgi:hypothetical protein
MSWHLSFIEICRASSGTLSELLPSDSGSGDDMMAHHHFLTMKTKGSQLIATSEIGMHVPVFSVRLSAT